MQRSVCVFLLFFLAACEMRRDRPTGLTADFYERVYFTPGTECEDAIADLVRNAQNIRIAVYAITNTKIGDAIIAAHKRGADIRIISDRTQAKNKASLIDTFRENGIPVALNHGYKIEHNKFAVFDNKTIITGSYNWTINASLYNSENCMIQNTLSLEYGARFDALWNKYANN